MHQKKIHESLESLYDVLFHNQSSKTSFFLGVKPEIAEEWMLLWLQSDIVMSNWAEVLVSFLGLVSVKRGCKWTIERVLFMQSAPFDVFIACTWNSHTLLFIYFRCCLVVFWTKLKFGLNYMISVRGTYSVLEDTGLLLHKWSHIW